MTSMIPSAWQEILQQLSNEAENETNPDAFCERVVAIARPLLELETVILFEQVDDSTLDTKARTGPAHGNLIDNRFLKFNRSSPMGEAYRLQRPHAWGNCSKLLTEFPELSYWPRMLHGVIAVPISRKGKAIAGCVFVTKDGFSESTGEQYEQVFTEIAELVYQVYLRRSELPLH